MFELKKLCLESIGIQRLDSEELTVTKSDIPVSARQILYLALTMFAPMLFTIGVVALVPAKSGQSASSEVMALTTVGVILVGLVSVLLATVSRRVVEIRPDLLVVKYSLYTLAVNRSDIKSVQVWKITSLNQLGLSTRKNGIAAFGYFSGWFCGLNGDLTFCALSKWPVYLVTFDGDVKCKQLAISASDDLARQIESWTS